MVAIGRQYIWAFGKVTCFDSEESCALWSRFFFLGGFSHMQFSCHSFVSLESRKSLQFIVIFGEIDWPIQKLAPSNTTCQITRIDKTCNIGNSTKGRESRFTLAHRRGYRWYPAGIMDNGVHLLGFKLDEKISKEKKNRLHLSPTNYVSRHQTITFIDRKTSGKVCRQVYPTFCDKSG